jgi:PAS domain S-box-containing protein
VTRFWSDQSLRTKGWVVLALPVVALCVGALVFSLQDRREQRAETWVRHSYEVKSGLQQVDFLLSAAEVSVRGFLIDGQPETLADFEAAQAALPASVDTLAGLVADNPSQSAQLTRLRSLAGQCLTALTAERDAAVAAGVFPATVPVAAGQAAGAARTAVAQQLDAMRAEEDRLLAERTGAADHARARTRSAILITVALGLLGSLLATSLFTSGIAGRIRRLATNAERLARGQPVAPIDPAGDEVGRLAAELETASELLREREAALARESDLLSALMDNIPYPVFFKDTESRYLRVNKASARLVGEEDPARFVGLSDFNFFPPDQAQELWESEQRLMAEREPIVNRVQFSTVRDHGPRWGLDNKAPIVDRAGRVIGLVGSSVDITEMKRAEEALAHLAAIVESSADAIVGMTLDGTITSWNPGAERIYGYAEHEILGRPVATLVRADREGEMAEILAEAAKGVAVGRQEAVHVAKGGRAFDAAFTLSPVWESGGTVTGAAMIARNVSARKQAELALEAANKELEAFTYSVSHDLRAPLRAMNGFSRILIEDYAAEMPDEARHYLRLVQDNARQMGLLVDDLLAFSRLGRQPVVKRPVPLTSLVYQVYEDLQEDRAGRQVEFAVGDLPVVEADPGLMRQVFANLLGNALKFTRRREVARIEVGIAPEHARPGEVVFYVKDNGVGFDMAYVAKLFGVFQRLHRAEEYEGTGVGLALVQRIVHRHGGRVWVEAEVDKGATFYVALPPAAPVEAAAPADEAAAVA